MEYDYINLRPYFTALARRWRILIVVPLLGAILAVALSLSLPNTYVASASALLFIRQTGTQIGAGEPLLTIETIDMAARRQGLVAIANSDMVEAEITPDVAAPLAMQRYVRGRLNKQIAARANGDLIVITAKGRTAEQAKNLADTWTQAFVAYAASKYTDQHSQVQLASTAFMPNAPVGVPVSSYAAIGALGSLLLMVALIVGQQVLRARVGDAARVKGVPRPAKYPTT